MRAYTLRASWRHIHTRTLLPDHGRACFYGGGASSRALLLPAHEYSSPIAFVANYSRLRALIRRKEEASEFVARRALLPFDLAGLLLACLAAMIRAARSAFPRSACCRCVGRFRARARDTLILGCVIIYAGRSVHLTRGSWWKSRTRGTAQQAWIVFTQLPGSGRFCFLPSARSKNVISPGERGKGPACRLVLEVIRLEAGCCERRR